MFRRRVTLWGLFLIFAYLLPISCSVAPVSEDVDTEEFPTVRWLGTIQPYLTVTPSPIPLVAEPTIEALFSPTPIATPLTHTVVKDETLLGIAFRYGIPLEALLVANPEVDPRLLTIGQVLIIPAMDDTPAPPGAIPTLVPLNLSAPRCYPSGDGGAVCIVEAKNDQAGPIENIQVWMGLFDQEQNLADSRISIPALNLLFEGQKTALVAYFPPPLPVSYLPKAELISASIANAVSARYVVPILQDLNVEIKPSKLEAHVEGVFTVNESVRWLWVLGMVYDEYGQIVGVRKWKEQPDCTDPAAIEAGTDNALDNRSTAAPRPCEPIEFEMDVFSAGPEIYRVEMRGEAGR